MKKTANLVFTVLFLLFLGAVAAITLKQGDSTYSYFENRSLAKAPEYSRESLLDGSLFSAWERFSTDRAAGRGTMIRISTLLRMELLKLPQVNEVVVTEDRLLHFYPYGSWEDADPAQQSAETAQSLAELQAHVEENGGRFYFVGLPNQLSYFQECYPDYLDRAEDYLPALHRAFPEALARKGVNFIDLVAAFEAMGKPAEYYTETDHHYSLKGAMVSYRVIVERLQADGLDIPLLEEEDWEYTTLPNPFLGSRNRKLYALWETRDRLTYAVPREEIPFTRTDNGQEVASTVLRLPENDTAPVEYLVYMGGDKGETILRTDRPELPKVLIFGDSFTNALETLLYPSFDEMRSLDLRHYNAKTLWEYIEDYQPDIVLDIRDDSSWGDPTSPNSIFR